VVCNAGVFIFDVEAVKKPHADPHCGLPQVKAKR
jgi:hypothetical protein